MRIVAFLLILAGVSTVATAQETGTRMGKTAEEKDVTLVLQKIGACMARNQAEVTRKWLDLIPGSAAEDKFAITHEGEMTVCMEQGDSHLVTAGKLEYEPLDMRRFMALEAGRRAALVVGDSLPGTASQRPWFADALAAMKKGEAIDARSIVQQEFGHCVVIANWAAARDLLRSEPKSKEETAAIQALAPSLGPCIDAGAKVELTRSGVRNALSEPFYHLANAPAQSAGATQ